MEPLCRLQEMWTWRMGGAWPLEGGCGGGVGSADGVSKTGPCVSVRRGAGVSEVQSKALIVVACPTSSPPTPLPFSCLPSPDWG